MIAYIYLVTHPEYAEVRVSAVDKIDAIRKACEAWGANWKQEAAYASAIRGAKARAGLCPRCREFSATGGLCVRCQALEHAGQYLGKQDRRAGVRGSGR